MSRLSLSVRRNAALTEREAPGSQLVSLRLPGVFAYGRGLGRSGFHADAHGLRNVV